jgi:hypothetical protein
MIFQAFKAQFAIGRDIARFETRTLSEIVGADAAGLIMKFV